MKKILIISILLTLSLNTSIAQFNTVGRFPEKRKTLCINLLDTMTCDTSLLVPPTAVPMSFSLPLHSLLRLTSTFGKRMHPVYHEWKAHRGIDLEADYEPVYSIGDGIVNKTGTDEISGNYVVITHGDGSVESLYAHLSYILVQQGEKTSAGQVIGVSGSTGAVTGPHLHFGIKQNGVYIDPFPVLKLMLLQR